MTWPSSSALKYVRARATEAMNCTVQIYRRDRPEGYDEDTLVYTPEGPKELAYEGAARIWELSSGASVTVGDDDFYQQSTQMSIPWAVAEVIQQYDEVTVLSCATDDQMVGKRYEVQTAAKAGQMRATRRFEVIGRQD